MKKNILLLLLLPCILFGQSEYAAISIPTEMKEHANSVLMDEKVEVDISQTGQMKIKTLRATAVLNQLGDNKTGAVVYHDDSRTILDIEAYVYDALGNEVQHYKKRDFKDVSVADGFSLFNDSRAMYLDYTPTSYPYTLVFISEVKSDDTAFIFPWVPVDGYTMSVMNSERIIKFDTSNRVRFKTENLEALDIAITEGPDEIKCVATNVKALRYEEQAPPFSSIAPKVHFALDTFSLKGVPGYGKDWTEFGKWMNSSLLTGVNELPESTLRRVKSLVANETTNEAKARKIYQYVQDKVRYISVQVGIGGWKPMLASDVDQLSYGDCKALTNYTKALLDAVDVPSYYTILYAGDNEKDIMSDFSSMQGNHVILGVENGDEDITWLECTSQDTPYGYLGNFTDDRDVLMITPDGGKIMHTKIYGLEENVQESTAKITLNNDGSAQADFTSISQGLQYDGMYELEKKTDAELENNYKNRWGYHNGIQLESIELNNDREKIEFTENLKIKIPSYATKVGEEYLIELNAFNQSQYVPPRISDRKQKLELSMAYKDVDTYEIELPSDYTLDSMPEDNTIENKFGRYSVSFEKIAENKIKVKRMLLMKKGTFPASDYNKYRNFRRTIAKFDKTKILLTPKI